MIKTALISGSTAGIGKATALLLAQRGWTIIVHGKEEPNCQESVKELKQISQNPNIHYCCADLADLKAVEQMANEIIHRFPTLNVLINNAGTFSHDRKLTKDKLEMTWVVNYLSRFILTKALLGTLKQNAPSRIIDVSGAYHAKGHINFEDINLERNYSMARANNQSKLANVLFTHHLSKLLKGSNVTINTLHPGAVNTGAVLKSEGFSTFSKWIYRLMSPFFKTPEQGAESSVFLAESNEVEGVSGKYFINKKEKKTSKISNDDALQQKLWNFSHELLE